MIEPDSVTNLKDAFSECIRLDERVLTTLRGEIRPLKNRNPSPSTAGDHVDFARRHRWR